MTEWTSISGFDAHTAISSPHFAGNGDCHLTSPEGLTVAHPLDYVTTDIDGEVRSNTPCAGADEYNGIYAVGEQETVESLFVYPNPTQGVVTIAIGENSAFEYQVLDLAGRTVIKGKCLSPATTIDLSGIVKGVYFISVKCDVKCLTQKVIVQ